MFMRRVYDEKLAQAAYVLGCQRTGEAIVIDPQRDVDRYLRLARENGLRITAVAETHIHADFLSGARELAERVGATVYASDEGDADWKYAWLDRAGGGAPYDHRLLRDGDTFRVGGIELQALHTPGHTPEHLSFLVVDRGGGADAPIGLLSGDFVFVGDLGRPDLLETAAGQTGQMEPSARRLFASVRRLSQLEDYLQVWPAHGAGSACGKALGAVPTSTLGYERRFNPAIRAAGAEAAFVDYILSGQPEPPVYFARMKRDNKLGPPLLGELPRPPQLSRADVDGLDAQRTAIVDTRSWDAFRAGHVAGSLWLPLNRSFPTDAGSFIEPVEPIVLVCAAEQVEEAVRDLVRIGLDRMAGWLPVGELGKADGLATLPEWTPAELEERLRQRTLPILDVRRATEFAEGHIPGAVNIAHTRLAARRDEVPGGTPLVVNCLAGGRSGRAAAYLRRLGHDVVNLRGGIDAWRAASGRAG